jgi:catechol 2,3-dioxygenase-like lactoylglutathione lyase family enzyme
VQTRRRFKTKEIRMKRFHVHVAVDDLAQSIKFYSTLFGAKPTVREVHYAKWMLDDPRVNFAISSRGRAAGVNHLGFQVDSTTELAGMRAQLEAADSSMVEQTAAACCYARSDKYWVTDPSGIAWETFHSLGAVPVYGEDDRTGAQQSNCCVPLAQTDDKASSGCCVPARDQSQSGCCT